MTEVNSLQTNEFLRRRKLRFQQVREQSKDIAKKIRQRAKVEKLRQVSELDSKKQKEYLHRQECLVKRLEKYYAQGIENVGAGHKNASELQCQGEEGDKVDLSKKRGQEAAAELRKKRQQILDEQKKILDRKLQAREAANEISREKSNSVINKLQPKPGSKDTKDIACKPSVGSSDKHAKTKHANENEKDVAKNDMATQWDLEEMPNEWEPHIPTLALPKDDNCVKESNNNNVDSKSDKNKRLDLFALSNEMPSSLRGSLNNQEERVPSKSSLTLVSEYLQNRRLRLRESSTVHTSKQIGDLQSLKQTILRTRASKEGIMNLCHVHDEELVPVPSWQAESNCGFCPHRDSLHDRYESYFTTASTLQLNQKYSITSPNPNFPGKKINSVRPPCRDPHAENVRSAKRKHTVNKKSFHNTFPKADVASKSNNFVMPVHPDLLPSPVLRGTSPFTRNKDLPKCFSGKANIDKRLKSTTESTIVAKKSSVTMYNHLTRDCRDVPYNDDRLVVRESQAEDDAYSQAMRESTTSHSVEKDHHKKIQEIRSKVAVTKQNVEKEYQDTISFLNAMPKDKGTKTIKTAFMDEQRQQMKNDSRQQKLQQEYRKIERECAKRSCKNKVHRKSRSPTKANDMFQSTDFQYSWMPVPDSDGNLAVHTIPTSLKNSKSGNTVKFSKVDSYHEYRSRHKHTPPTKETTQERPKKNVEAVLIQNDSSETDSLSSESSSVRLENDNETVKDLNNLSDAERIIIYKILDSKVDKRKKTSKLIKGIAKSLTQIKKQNSNAYPGTSEKSDKNSTKCSEKTANADNRVSFEELSEGVYKTVNEHGDNIASMYFHDKEGQIHEITPDELNREHSYTSMNNGDQHRTGSGALRKTEKGDIPPSNTPRSRTSCTTDNKDVQPSTAPSSSSFISQSNKKPNNAMTDRGFIELMDNCGQESGKFYIGASGLLKNDAYEVIIQVRKKGDDKEAPNKNCEVDSKKRESSNEKSNMKENEDPDVSIERITTTCSEDNLEINPSNKVAIVSTVAEVAQDINKTNTNIVVTNVVPDVQIDRNSEPVAIDCNQISGNLISTEPINVCDKGVSTSSQDTSAVQTTIQKTENIPRPATSTYTQTSISSPNHRPVFFHMSSSTSTAYMSPPDMILPTFMRHNHQLTDEEICDSRNYEIDNDAGRREYSGKHKCKCRKCMQAKKVISSKQFHAPTHRCRKRISQNDSTPPNTSISARSYSEDEEHTGNHKKSKKYHEIPDANKLPKCKCRKCERQSKKEEEQKEHNFLSSKKLKHLATKQLARDLDLGITTSAASSKKDKLTQRSKSTLQPVITKYIDKLLILNRESLRAVQVIDQDCSSVNTPGSSIIDVPDNTNQNKPVLEEKLSLQQIQSMLIQKLVSYKRYHKAESEISRHEPEFCIKQQNKNKLPKFQRKNTAHKVKKLNISRNLIRAKKECGKNQSQSKTISSSSTTRECVKEQILCIPTKNKFRSRSSPTPKLPPSSGISDRSANSDLTVERNYHGEFAFKPSENKTKPTRSDEQTYETGRTSASSNRGMLASKDFGNIRPSLKDYVNNGDNPMSISTQTSTNVDSEISFVKLAEDKLQNMEKIASLTEKCTQRLSNLAKVLEEVRKNKSLAYSQISSSDTNSDSDQKSEKNGNKYATKAHEQINSNPKSPVHINIETLKENDDTFNSTAYIPLLSDIPKPVTFKNLNSDSAINSSSGSSKKSNPPSPVSENDDNVSKHRGKPPPALSRIHLKHGQDVVVPHELSTVVEVDSPLSLKLKSSRNDTKLEGQDANRSNGTNINSRANSPVDIKSADANHNPDLLNSYIESSKHKMSVTDSSDNSKMQMIDIHQFNEIMLKPFFSLQEYAKQRNGCALDDGSNLDEILKNDHINDELSSLHSEASLPDVISELLKRNIISEPFKFDTGSNANSTTASSESTISVLALSKARQNKKRSGVMFQNKENIGETSDTLSISSNPDLENAFKKLGMGWASSTLKKTKERLALSSSSNTSSSSLSQFKVKSFNPDVPALVTDTVSAAHQEKSKKPVQRNAIDSSKNAQQQTSLSNSMTVKEFLTNELAKKITFNNQSTEEEFVSLFETRIPEEMKHSSRVIRQEDSIDHSMRSGNNRARTSTPVQLFKSMTYHSISSSNMSNGLFSNADDLSSVKVTSNSFKHSTSDKDDLIIPNFSLRLKRASSECSKSD